MDDVRKSRVTEAFSSITREDVQQALNGLDAGTAHWKANSADSRLFVLSPD
jgi:hypothetical protein